MARDEYFHDVTCATCGKTFICYNQHTWVYHCQRGGKHLFFCKWSCLRKYEDARSKQPTRRGRRKKNDGHTEVSKTDQD